MSTEQSESKSNRPKVLASLEDADGFRCVDIFQRADLTFGFKEFRRDPEDAGVWTLVGDFSHRSFSTTDEALRGAAESIPWFGAIRSERKDT